MKAVQSKIGRKIFYNRASGREVLNAIRNKGIAIIKIGSNALILSK